MTGRHYINGKDTYTQWGVVIGTIEGLNFPKRKVAYTKAWEGYSGTDVILGGYESREIGIEAGVKATAGVHVRALLENFLRDLASMGEFVLYDARRKEGVVCYLSDEVSRKNTYHLVGGFTVFKIKLQNSYPVGKTFIATSGAAQTVSITLKSTSLPCKVFWGDGTNTIARTTTVSKSLAAGTWHVVVAADSDFNPEVSVTGATIALTI